VVRSTHSLNLEKEGPSLQRDHWYFKHIVIPSVRNHAFLSSPSGYQFGVCEIRYFIPVGAPMCDGVSNPPAPYKNTI
jgi:hypothetical protein